MRALLLLWRLLGVERITHVTLPNGIKRLSISGRSGLTLSLRWTRVPLIAGTANAIIAVRRWF